MYLVNAGPPHNQQRLYRAPLDGSAEPVLCSRCLRTARPSTAKETIGGDFFDCPTFDQRGIARPQGLRCDIGAFELPQGAGDTVPDLPEGDSTRPPQAEPATPAGATADTTGAYPLPATPVAP